MKLLLTKLLIFLLLCSKAFAVSEEKDTPPSFLNTSLKDQSTHVIPTAMLESIDNRQESEKAKKINPSFYGVVKKVNINIRKDGLMEKMPDGGTIWRHKISSPTAHSLEVFFERYHLPSKARLFLYNENHTKIIGALTGKNATASNTLVTQPVEGNAVIVEYYEPADVEFAGEVVVGEIIHDFANVLQFIKGQGPFVPVADYRDVSCIKNVSCFEGIPYSDQAKAVGLILYKMPGGKYVGHATGTLINNSNNDGQPYFLTAFHNTDGSNADCSDGTDLCFDYSKWVILFNHYDSDCNGNGSTVSNSVINSVTGAQFLSGSKDKDYLLLRLNSKPENVCYAGWSRTSTPQPPFADIHHPLGDVKKISFYDRQIGSSIPGYWNIDNWSSGYTSQGSSGSALLDNNKRIIGVLYSGEGGDYCETDPNHDPRIHPNPDDKIKVASSLFGRFSSSFTDGHFETYLGNVQQTDVYCPMVQACPGNNQRQMRTGVQERTESICVEVNFSASKTNALKNEIITFTNLTTGGGSNLTYYWDFGSDAFPSTSTSATPPPVLYNNIGSKTVSLQVCEGVNVNCITELKTFYIDIEEPSTTMTVNFAANKRAVKVGEQIYFSSTVYGAASSPWYNWNFGPGAIVSSNSMGYATVSYNTSGVKSVSLNVIDRAGAVVETKNAYITVNEPDGLPLEVDFEGCMSGMNKGGRIVFINTTRGGDGFFADFTYEWNFGDGTTSTQRQPVHNYDELGSYDVSLKVCDESGKCNVKTKTSCVQVTTSFSYTGDFTINGRAFENGNSPIEVGVNWPVVISVKNPEIANTNYDWEFDYQGFPVLAQPGTASSYGPHTVFYKVPGYFSAKLFLYNNNPQPYNIYKSVPKIKAIRAVPMGIGTCKAQLGNVSLSSTCWSKNGPYPQFTATVASASCPYVIRVKSAKIGQFLTDGKIDFAGGVPVFPYTDTYTISLNHYDGESYTLYDFRSITVTIYGPIANAGGDVKACPNTPLVLGSTSVPNIQYTWSCSPSTGVNYLNNATQSNPTFNTVIAGTYSYTVSARDLTSGCTTSDEVNVTIKPVTVGNNIYNTCMGGIETLNLSIAGGSGGFTGAWTPATYLTDANILTPNVLAPQFGTSLLYNLTVTDSKGCKGTGTAVVNVSAVAPSGLVTVAGSREVKLTWIDNSTTETAFVVERSATSTTTGFVAIATLSDNTTTYTDKTAALGVTYYYRVYPKNVTTINLGYSNTASAYTNLPIAWNKTYGGIKDEDGVKIYPTSDGGYIVGSTSASNAGGDVTESHSNGPYIGGTNAIWILKLDACGNKVWDKKYNLLEQTYYFRDLVEVSDGYIVLGTKYLPNAGAAYNNSLSPLEAYVTKISKSGVKIWEKTYGNINAEFPWSIIPSGDGGFIIVVSSDSPAGRDKSQGFIDGSSYYYNFPNSDLWILKIDGNGNKIWDRTIGNVNRDEGFASICASGDGGYLISSYSGVENLTPVTPNGPVPLTRLTKINGNGDRLWTYTYSSILGSFSGSTPIIRTLDGNYIIGSTINGKYVLIKVDPNGTELWNKRYGGGSDYLTSIKEFPNGDLLLGGFSSSSKSGQKSESSYGSSDYWILRTDLSGNIIWDKTIRGTGEERLGNLAVLNNESFLMAGFSKSPVGGDKSEASRGGSDIWILKVGEGQNAGSMTLGNINPTAYFPSATVAIPFNASCLKPGETFTAQLSDQNGSFSSPVNIGTFSGANSGTINGILPADAIPGTSYKIRVISSVSNSTTLDNGQYITVKPSQITTGAISPVAYMPGATMTVPYSILGGFKSGNIFTAQLSDANGYFVNSVNIGTLTSTAAGTISAIIPASTPAGRGYRIRVVGSNLLVYGSDNAVNISVGRLFTETITDKVYYSNDVITVPFTALGIFNSGNVFTAILSDANGSFASNTAIIGTLASTSSGSVTGAIPFLAVPGAGYRVKVKSSNPAIEGTINANDIVIGSPTLTLRKIPASGILSGTSFTVSYLINGRYNSGNQFTAQLSDAQGSFLRPITVGSAGYSANGLIDVQIPLMTPTGTGYRIRLISSSPSTVSNDNGLDISISGIITNNVSPETYYAGTKMTVGYQTNIAYSAGNVFNLELSDINGSFDNPLNIGSSSQPGPITATIPINVPAGNLYRVRVTATNPAVTGLPNPESITITKSSITVNLASNTMVCPGSSLMVPFTSAGVFYQGNVYKILLSDAAGNFENATVLEVVTFSGGMNSGVGSWGVNTTLIPGTLSGTGYKIRVQSSNPFAYGDAPLIVSELPRAVSLLSSTNVSYGEPVNIKAGSVLAFDGIDDQVYATGFLKPANGGAVTVEFWLKVNAGDVQNSSAFSVGSSHTDRLQAHAPWGDGFITFDYGSLSNPASRISANYVPYLGKWTHVAFVSSGKANTFKAIYLNGELVNSANSSDGNTGILSGIKLGCFVNNSLYMKGMMDDFRIWNTMRSQSEIQNGMSNFISRNTPGLALALQMHEGKGTVVTDNSGNGLNGTVSGPVWTIPFANLTYNWMVGTTPAQGTNITTTPTKQTTITLTTLDNTNGCTAKYNTTVDVGGGIATSSVNPLTYYRGNPMNVSFTTNMTFNAASMFNVQLSDAKGSFDNPTTIGFNYQLGTINCTIPVNTPVGTDYRVRVVSQNPQVIGWPNPENISIIASSVNIDLNENSKICTGIASVPITTSGYFAPNNVFTLLLSDRSGFFSVPVTLNSFPSSISGSSQISFELPRNINFSGRYKLRLQSSNPYSYDDVSILSTEGVRATSLFSTTSICPGQTVTMTAGKVINFNGNAVTVQGYTNPANGGAITVEFWLRPRTNVFNENNGIAFWSGSGLSRLQAIVPGNDNRIVFEYGELFSSSRSIAADYISYLDRWTHVALVSSGKANTFKAIYLNGELVASANSSDGNSTLLSGLQIGGDMGTNYLAGMMDEFRVWTKMRTQAEIKEGMYKMIQSGTPGLKLYLQMHEVSGMVKDKSGNGLNGALNGTGRTSIHLDNVNSSWYSSAGTLTGPSASVTPMQTTVYSLIVKHAYSGCEARDFTTVTVKPIPCTPVMARQFDTEEGSAAASAPEDENSQEIEIYPNPNDGLFSISITESPAVTIEIIDAKGIVVKEIKGSGTKFNVEALELSAGLYVVKVTGNGAVSSRKITIQK